MAKAKKKITKHRRAGYRVIRKATSEFSSAHLPGCWCCPTELLLTAHGIDLSNQGRNHLGGYFLPDGNSNVIRLILHELRVQTNRSLRTQWWDLEPGAESGSDIIL